MLAALFGSDLAFMGELMTWLLAAAVLGLLAGGLLWRRRADARRDEAEREAQRLAAAAAEARRLAAERAEAERVAAAEREARRQAALLAEQQLQAADAQRRAAEQAEAQRQAELRAERQRLAAEQAEAERLAAEQAAQVERQRLVAEQAERERLAAAAAEREAQRLAAEQAAVPPPPTPKSAAQTLVLVADDSKVVRIKTGRLLAQHQYQVSYASDGLDAVQQMQAQPPDVLITDVEMPGMDGFELTRHIRGNPQTAQLPVIMITAADDRHRDEASAAGVSVLLGKPYSDEALIAHIRLAMGHDQTEAAPA
jgi:CheY-like chemotaxis protein